MALEVTLRVGPELKTLREEVAPGEIEMVARLRAEATLMRRAYELRSGHEAELARPGYPSLAQWFRHWFWARYEIGLWGRGITSSGREKDVLKMFRYTPEDWLKVPMDGFTVPMCQRLVAQVGRTHAPSTTLDYHRTIALMFGDAVRYGLDDGRGFVPWRARTNPMLLVRAPAVPKTVRRTLNSDELSEVLIAAKALHGGAYCWTTSVLVFQALLGLRIGEVVTLRWDQIAHLPDGAGVITWLPGDRKGGVQGLRLPVPKVVMGYLPPRGIGRVFTTKSPKSVNKDVNNALRAAVAHAGLDPTRFTTHNLRHSFAHLVYSRAGAVTTDVSRALGHSSEATTRRYLRGVDDMARLGVTIGAHVDAVVKA